MHKSVVAFLYIATAACNRAPAPISFDGAGAVERQALLRHGERLTHVLGCTGCHTPALTGQNFLEDLPQFGAVYASNLTQVVPHYSDAQLEGILRRGVHPIRKQMWIMPSEVFQNLSPPDMTALIARLRSLPPSGAATPPPSFTPLGEKLIASRQARPAAELVQEAKAKPMIDMGQPFALGRYVASVTCAECHGSDLTGIRNLEPGIDTPNLTIAGGYSRADFERLMTTGVPVGGRKLRIMGTTAQKRFSQFTPHERDALYAYLKARADKVQ